MKKFTYNFCAVCFMLLLVLLSLYTVGNDMDFFRGQYEKNNTTAATGMSMEDLEDATELMLDYLNDETDSLDMTVEKWGAEKELFDSREKTHMIDVKILYKTFFWVMVALTAISAIGFLLMFFADRQYYYKNLAKSFRFALIFAVILCVIFGSVFTIGFGRFWTLFHEIMFTNDLWLLDPKISTMINMFPLNFWLAMCTRALTTFAVMFVGTFGVAQLLAVVMKKVG